MRTLDAVKRGFDAILNDARDPTTLRVVQSDRTRAIDNLRRTWVGMLDEGNPDYAVARQAWAGPSQSLDAMNQGRQAIRQDRDVVAGIFSGMAPADQEFFRLGMGRAVSDMASDPRNAPGAVRQLLENRQMQARLNTAIPDPAQRAQFRDALEQELRMAATNNAISPRAGSQTGRLRAGGGLLLGAIQAAQNPTLYGAASRAALGLYRRAEGINPATASSLQNLLLDTSPQGRAAGIAALRSRQMNDLVQVDRGRARVRPVVRGVGAGTGLLAE